MKREDVITLLRDSNNHETKFRGEVLNALNSLQTIMYRFDRNMDVQQQYKTLNRRIKSSDLVGLNGLNELLIRLNEEVSDSFELLTLSTDNKSYLLYITSDFKRLIGIVCDDNFRTRDYLDLQEQYLERQLDVNIMQELV